MSRPTDPADAAPLPGAPSGTGPGEAAAAFVPPRGPLVVRALGLTIDAATLAGAAAVALMMAHIAVDVTSKYIFQAPMPGTITIVSNYYMVLVAFLPMAFTERRNGHIAVEVLTAHFPAPVQRGLAIFSLIFCAGVFGALAWQSWIEAGRAMAVGAFEIEQDRKLLTWPARYLLPLGAGLMTLSLLAKIWLSLVRGAAQDIERPYF